MLQLKQHLSRAFFFQKMTSCALHYDVIYHPLPINSQYLQMWEVDSPVYFQYSGTPPYGQLILTATLFWPPGKTVKNFLIKNPREYAHPANAANSLGPLVTVIRFDCKCTIVYLGGIPFLITIKIYRK